jgi:hypothetical protein
MSFQRSINFHLVQTPSLDGLSYNYEPHVQQTHTKATFVSGCLQFLETHDILPSHRVGFCFSTYNAITLAEQVWMWHYAPTDTAGFPPDSTFAEMHFRAAFEIFCDKYSVKMEDFFTMLNINVRNTV